MGALGMAFYHLLWVLPFTFIIRKSIFSYVRNVLTILGNFLRWWWWRWHGSYENNHCSITNKLISDVGDLKSSIQFLQNYIPLTLDKVSRMFKTSFFSGGLGKLNHCNRFINSCLSWTRSAAHTSLWSNLNKMFFSALTRISCTLWPAGVVAQILRNFRFDYEYTIKYENEFSNPAPVLKISNYLITAILSLMCLMVWWHERCWGKGAEF